MELHLRQLSASLNFGGENPWRVRAFNFLFCQAERGCDKNTLGGYSAFKLCEVAVPSDSFLPLSGARVLGEAVDD